MLAPSEVGAWIRREAHNEPLARIQDIVLPTGVDVYDPGSDNYADWLERVAHAARQQNLQPMVSQTHAFATLRYAEPGKVARSVLVNPGTNLAELGVIAQSLASRFSWREADAVAFVLSGLEPPLPTTVVTTISQPIPELDRVTLKVDPRKSASEVKQVYAEVRRSFWRVRDKEMQDKSLALAVFTEHHRHSGESWPELRERWNDAVKTGQPHWGIERPEPAWAYVDPDPVARRFGTDCRKAWTNVTGLAWPSTTDRGLGKDVRR